MELAVRQAAAGREHLSIRRPKAALGRDSQPRVAGRYAGCYVRATVSGDSSDHALASDAHLHTRDAGTRGLIIVPLCTGIVRTRGCTSLYLGLLGNFQGIIHFDAEVSDRALKLGMAQEQLNRSQVLRPFVDQRHLGSAHGVSAVGAGVEAGCGNPLVDDPGVLPCRNMRRPGNPTGKQILLRFEIRFGNPGSHSRPGGFG